MIRVHTGPAGANTHRECAKRRPERKPKLVRALGMIADLQGGGIVSADTFAAKFGTSARTIYRDIANLREAGFRVEGAAGFGFMLRERRA